MSNNAWTYDLLRNRRACVGSGHCCKSGPCNYGDWDAARHQCKHLIVAASVDGIEIHACGIYDKIVGQPDAKWNPAFGTECCQPMFNDNRNRIIKLLIRGNETAHACLDGRIQPTASPESD